MISNFLNALGLRFCFRWGRRAGRIHSLSHEIVGVKVGGVTCFFWRSSQAASLSARIFFFFCTCLSAVRYRCIDMPNNRRGRSTAELRNGKSGPCLIFHSRHWAWVVPVKGCHMALLAATFWAKGLGIYNS